MKIFLKHHAPHLVVHAGLVAVVIVLLVTAPLSLLALSHQPKSAKVPVRVISSHVCDKHDYITGCALPQANLKDIKRGVDPTLQGVDFGWSCPVGSAQNFGASYLSYDTSKDWSSSCINAFHSAHKATVAVWEAGANDAQGSYNLGLSQARQAVAQLRALGAPSNQPFDMAIDCDCAGSSLVQYFKGANAGAPGRVNAYGGFYQIQYLYDNHLVGHLNWQTYAWSGGRWLPASIAPLEQYLNSTSVDYDRAIASNYGQWPFSAPTPRTICWGKGSTPDSSACKKIEADAHKLWRAYLAFSKALPGNQKAAIALKKEIVALQKKYSATNKNVKAEIFWKAAKKNKHDGIIKTYHG